MRVFIHPVLCYIFLPKYDAQLKHSLWYIPVDVWPNVSLTRAELLSFKRPTRPHRTAKVPIRIRNFHLGYVKCFFFLSSKLNELIFTGMHQ